MALKAVGSNLTIHPIEKSTQKRAFFQLNPPLKVGEIRHMACEISLAGKNGGIIYEKNAYCITFRTPVLYDGFYFYLV